MFGAVLPSDDSIVLNQQSSKWNSHPAILTAMVVYLARLPCFPTYRKQLVVIAFVDQVAGIV